MISEGSIHYLTASCCSRERYLLPANLQLHQQPEQGTGGGVSALASMLLPVAPIKSDSARVATAITALVFIICPQSCRLFPVKRSEPQPWADGGVLLAVAPVIQLPWQVVTSPDTFQEMIGSATE